MHNNQSIIEAFSVIAREKNIDRTNLGTIIEDLFMTLIEKKYGEECDNFSVIVNMEKGEIEIYQEMMIVSEVGDDVKEISLEEANQLEPSLVIGDPFIKVHQPSDFGRRLINTAKQHLSQKIKDVEFINQYKGNRVLVFDAWRWHSAQQVRRECYEMRPVIVFKTELDGTNRERLDFYK